LAVVAGTQYEVTPTTILPEAPVVPVAKLKEKLTAYHPSSPVGTHQTELFVACPLWVSVTSEVNATLVSVELAIETADERPPSNATVSRRAVGNVPVVNFAASTPEAICAFETVPHADVPEPVPPNTVFAVGVDDPVPTFDSTATTASPVF